MRRFTVPADSSLSCPSPDDEECENHYSAVVSVLHVDFVFC